MSQLPALSEHHQPVPSEPQLDRALACLANAIDLGTGMLPTDRAPSPALRDGLTTRADDLRRWLAPGRPDMRDEHDRMVPGEARVMVAALLAILPVQGSKGSVEDAERVQGLYLRALTDLPRFALRAACATALTRGLGGNRKYAPSPADLRAEAEREAQPWRAEAAKIRRVLAAQVEPPRPPEDVRKASAAAVRRSFRIPEGGFSSGQAHKPDDGADSIDRITADLAAKSNAMMQAYRESTRTVTAPEPEPGRFADEDAA